MSRQIYIHKYLTMQEFGFNKVDGPANETSHSQQMADRASFVTLLFSSRPDLFKPLLRHLRINSPYAPNMYCPAGLFLRTV